MSYILIEQWSFEHEPIKIVGVFQHEADAYAAAKLLATHDTNNLDYIVYSLPDVNTVTEEFIKRLPRSFHEALFAGKAFDVDKFKSFAPSPFESLGAALRPPEDSQD